MNRACVNIFKTKIKLARRKFSNVQNILSCSSRCFSTAYFARHSTGKYVRECACMWVSVTGEKGGVQLIFQALKECS